MGITFGVLVAVSSVVGAPRFAEFVPGYQIVLQDLERDLVIVAPLTGPGAACSAEIYGGQEDCEWRLLVSGSAARKRWRLTKWEGSCRDGGFTGVYEQGYFEGWEEFCGVGDSSGALWPWGWATEEGIVEAAIAVYQLMGLILFLAVGGAICRVFSR